MPQMTKGGKFIFGKSVIRDDGTVLFPSQAISEYDITVDKRVYLFTGSKSTGGFCVTRKGLLYNSKLSHILNDLPELRDFTVQSGEFIRYKGRGYCYIDITSDGRIKLTDEMLCYLNIKKGMELLSIRSSDIAFTMGAYGPLLEKSLYFKGEIPLY